MFDKLKNLWPLAYGLFAYAGFGATLLLLVGFLFNADVLPVTVDRGPDSAPWLAAGVNLLLITAFGLQHSVMARPGFKRVFTRIVPAELERSTYVMLSNVAVLALCFLWRPMPGIAWTVETVVLQAIAWSGFALAIVVLFIASFQIDHWELLGLRQTWNASRGRRSVAPSFTVRGMYRWVRHPIYVGWLLLFWITPTMTVGHLLLALGMTGYVLIAMFYEERDLLESIGRRYADYRQRVPALVPRPWRRFAGAGVGEQGKRRVGGILLVLALGPAMVPDLRAAAEAGDQPAAALEELVVRHGGRDRRVKLVVPSAGIEPGRIVVMLHGAGGDSDRIRRFTGFGFERLADTAGWAVAYPEGIAGTWNDCRSVPSYPARRLDIDDVAFLTHLVVRLRERFDVPAADVAVVGFCNGGRMALRMAIERPRAIGAFGVAAAQLAADDDSLCARAAPELSSLWVHGSNDPFLPYAGGASHGPARNALGDVQSVDATRQWALEAMPTASPVPMRRLPETDGDQATSIELREWRSGAGLVLQQYLLRGSGHVLPLRNGDFPAVVGRPARDAGFAEIVLGLLNALEGVSCAATDPCDRKVVARRMPQQFTR